MSIYFLTSVDDDYKIKGSRDPLALQTVWQKTARLLIPHLTSVSGNLKDFQTLALGLYCKRKYGMSEDIFANFWLRWEQLLAYTRYKYSRNNEVERDTILGNNKISNEWNNTLRLENKDIILLRQRSGGVWGRYNSPFREMHILDNTDFDGIFGQKITLIENETAFQLLLKDKNYSISKEELDAFWILFELEEEESKFWKKHLLSDNLERELFQIVTNNYEIISKMSFYDRLEFIWEQISEKYKGIITQILHTEHTISPVLTIFHYLQTRSSWTKKEIQADEKITSWKKESLTYIKKNILDSEDKKKLYEILAAKENWESIVYIVQRDAKVAKDRQGLPWINLEEDTLFVEYRQGEKEADDYNTLSDAGNSYFFNTYLSLFEALTKK